MKIRFTVTIVEIVRDLDNRQICVLPLLEGCVIIEEDEEEDARVVGEEATKQDRNSQRTLCWLCRNRVYLG